MALGESGKTISDADRQRAMDRASMLEALESGPVKRMRRPNATSPRPRLRPGTLKDASPSAERGDIMLMLQEMRNRRMAKPTEMKAGGAVKKKRVKKPKNGCAMRGRGGKYKGMK